MTALLIWMLILTAVALRRSLIPLIFKSGFFYYCVVSVLPIAHNTFSEEQLSPTVTREVADPTGIWKRKSQLGSPGGQDVNTHRNAASGGTRVWKQRQSISIKSIRLFLNFTQGCRL